MTISDDAILRQVKKRASAYCSSDALRIVGAAERSTYAPFARSLRRDQDAVAAALQEIDSCPVQLGGRAALTAR